MVRARRKGDIEKLFPDADVSRCTTSDYLYRAPVRRVDIALALGQRLIDIKYPNFKDSVNDPILHEAYAMVWADMVQIQPLPPYSGVDKRKKK